MFELTNEQRQCFALAPVLPHWKRVEAKAGPYDDFKTYLYIDDITIVKCVVCGETIYREYDTCEKTSEDGKQLLPKTSKGKPVLLSSSNILKRSGTGMQLNYHNKTIFLYNNSTQCCYYTNAFNDIAVDSIEDFADWVNDWCDDTTDTDIADIVSFSHQTRKHIRFNEGDVFRFKIGRRKYGYGRILLDYDKMRKSKEPFWDIVMTKAVVCSVYHIVTDRNDVSIEQLKLLDSMPSTVISDNPLFYGEYEIIGNIPVTGHEDYPIMYGNSLHIRDNAVCYQCGKVYRRLENSKELFPNFLNHSVSTRLHFDINILLQCIKQKSNRPYWKYASAFHHSDDLRNPKHKFLLLAIKKQMKV